MCSEIKIQKCGECTSENVLDTQNIFCGYHPNLFSGESIGPRCIVWGDGGMGLRKQQGGTGEMAKSRPPRDPGPAKGPGGGGPRTMRATAAAVGLGGEGGGGNEQGWGHTQILDKAPTAYCNQK